MTINWHPLLTIQPLPSFSVSFFCNFQCCLSFSPTGRRISSLLSTYPLTTPCSCSFLSAPPLPSPSPPSQPFPSPHQLSCLSPVPLPIAFPRLYSLSSSPLLPFPPPPPPTLRGRERYWGSKLVCWSMFQWEKLMFAAENSVGQIQTWASST